MRILRELIGKAGLTAFGQHDEATASSASGGDQAEESKYKVGDIIPASASLTPYNDFKVVSVKSGGYAHVYIVNEVGTHAKYALKTFQDWYLGRPGMVTRFMGEAATWLRLGKHPNVVGARSYILVDGRPYIILEQVAGPTLWRWMNGHALPIAETAWFAIQICRGMAHAGRMIDGFVHADLKSPNCLVDKDEVVKITDFGLARVTAARPESFKPLAKGSVARTSRARADSPPGGGTPSYMAPERFAHDHLASVCSDIYSFGVMMFEMLTGTRPFGGDTRDEYHHQHVTARPPALSSLAVSVPPALDSLVLGCLAKSPSDRPSDFEVLETELTAFARVEGLRLPPAPPPAAFSPEELIGRACGLLNLRRADEALAALEGVRQADSRVLSLKGDALAAQGRYADSLACYERAVELDPALASAWAGKGRVLRALGKHEASLASFEKVLSGGELGRAWVGKGETLREMGRDEDALTCFERGARMSCHGAEAHANAATSFETLGRTDEAAAALRTAVGIEPDDDVLHRRLGDVYMALGLHKGATESYKRAAFLRPDAAETFLKLKEARRGAKPTAPDTACARLSESLLWELRSRRLRELGPAAFDALPTYPVNNPFIGEAYADMILAFLLDYERRLDPREPLYVVQLGAGDGAFGYYCLSALLRKLSYFRSLQGLAVRFVLTEEDDAAEVWEGNPKLAELFDSGGLDYAVFRPESDETLVLRKGGEALSRGAARNPLIVIANYLFSGARQDLFRVQGSSLQEVRVCFTSSEAGSDVVPNFDRWRCHETTAPAGRDYYEDEKLNEVLREYAARGANRSFLIPVGAFECVRNLKAISGNRLVLISSDKGITSPAFDAVRHDRVFASHDGAFSYPVNYHAIGRYFELSGGSFLCTTQPGLHFETTINFLLPDAPPLDHSRHCFEEKVKAANIPNNLYDCEDLLTSAGEMEPEAALASCLAFIRLSGYDPVVLCLCGPLICKALGQPGGHRHEDLRRCLDRVGKQLFRATPELDPYEWQGRIHYELGDYAKALDAFWKSIEALGPNNCSLYHAGACLEIMGDVEGSLNSYRQALQMDSKCELSAAGIRRAETRIAERELFPTA